MAQGQGDSKPLRPRARIDRGTDLHDDWQEWQEHFDTTAEATTAALRRGLQDVDDMPDTVELDRLVRRGIAVMLLTVVAVVIGQTYVIAGGVWAAGLATFAIVGTVIGSRVPLERVIA